MRLTGMSGAAVLAAALFVTVAMGVVCVSDDADATVSDDDTPSATSTIGDLAKIYLNSDETVYAVIYTNYSVHISGSGATDDFTSSTAPFAEYAEKLLVVTVSGDITYIGSYVFYGCTALESVSIQTGTTGVTIGSYAFYGCTVESVKLTSVESIGSYAFYGCTALESVSFGSSTESIGSYAFYGCTSLSTLGGRLRFTTVDDHAFSGCTSLASFSSSYVTSVGGNAFQNCTALTSVTVSWASVEGYTFSGCTALTSVTFSASETSIGLRAFYGCTALKIASWSTKIVSIGNYAFYGCTALTTYNASNVTSIGSYAFQNCTSLKTATIASGVTSLPSYLFYGCTALTSVTIPDSVTSIGNYAFYGCTALTSVTIPDSVTSIGSYVFYGCTALTSMRFLGSTPTFNGSNALSLGTSSASVTCTVQSSENWAASSTYFTSSTYIGSYTTFTFSGLLVSSISLSVDYAYIAPGYAAAVTAAASPTNADDPSVTWSIQSGEDYATMTSTSDGGCVITATSAGTVVVKAAANDGSGVSKTISIYVRAATTTLSYDANGGEGTPSSQSVTLTQSASSYKSVTLSSTVPTRDGYIFLGWSLSSTATSASYQPGASYSLTYGTDRTIYAVWQLAVSSIEISGESEVVVGDTVTLIAVAYPEDVGDRSVTFEIVSGSSHASISSQSTTDTGGTCVISTVSAGDVLVQATASDGSRTYAQFAIAVNPVTYEVTFISDGSTYAVLTVEEGATVSSPVSPELEGCIFKGWYTDEDCTALYDFDTAVASDLTLYAGWEAEYDSDPVAVVSVTQTNSRIVLDASASQDVETVAWYVDGSLVGYGLTYTLTLDPGTYSVTAVLTNSHGQTSWSREITVEEGAAEDTSSTSMDAAFVVAVTLTAVLAVLAVAVRSAPVAVAAIALGAIDVLMWVGLI